MPGKTEQSKILKPNQMEIKLDPKVVKMGENLQIQLQTPEGRVIVTLIKICDYSWETDEVLLQVGTVDVTQAAQQGQFFNPA